MVSQANVHVDESAETAVRATGTNAVNANPRLLIPEETFAMTGPGYAWSTLYRPFWRPVIAGAIFTLSVFVLSWYLMIACRVGVAADGTLALGIGAAIWIWVAACVAYCVGGMIATAMTRSGVNPTQGSSGSGMLKGAVLWALTIPLALLIYSFVAGIGAPVVEAQMSNINSTGTLHLNLDMWFNWAVFITLGLGLIFALVGGSIGGWSRSPSA